MADNSPDYKALFLQAEERRKQAEERQKQAEVEGSREKERTRPTTFTELIRLSHNSLSRPLRVETPSRSTSGKIPLPSGKYCPIRLERWDECAVQLSELYRSVQSYLQPTSGEAPRLFTSLHELEGLGRRLNRNPISPCEPSNLFRTFAQ